MRKCLRLLEIEDNVVILSRGRNYVGDQEYHRAEFTVRECYKAATSKLCKSLDYENMTFRERSIMSPEEGTCEWIDQDDTFLRWQSKGNGLLWIKGTIHLPLLVASLTMPIGHAGSGKSIMMKAMSKRRQKALDGTRTLFMTFYFNARGSAIEMTPEALYRTLIREVVDQSPFMMCVLLTDYLKKTSYNNDEAWLSPELADIFHDQVIGFLDHHLEILIHALDECSAAEVQILVRRFEKIIKSESRTHALRVCWSSRFYPDVTLDAQLGAELILNKRNEIDIEHYVQTNFLDIVDTSYHSLGQSMIGRSKGIFLWVSLVLDRLLALWKQGRRFDELREVLSNIPDGLDKYFLSIFEDPSFSKTKRSELRNIMLLLLGAKRQLSVTELYAALITDTTEILLLNTHGLSSDEGTRFVKHLRDTTACLVEVIEDVQSAQPMINILDGHHGLLTAPRSSDGGSHDDMSTIPSVNSFTVQLIHESVRESFTCGHGLQLLENVSVNSLLTMANIELGRAACRHLSVVGIHITKHTNILCEADGALLNNMVALTSSNGFLTVPTNEFVSRYLCWYALPHMSGLSLNELCAETLLGLRYVRLGPNEL